MLTERRLWIALGALTAVFVIAIAPVVPVERRNVFNEPYEDLICSARWLIEHAIPSVDSNWAPAMVCEGVALASLVLAVACVRLLGDTERPMGADRRPAAVRSTIIFMGIIALLGGVAMCGGLVQLDAIAFPLD